MGFGKALREILRFEAIWKIVCLCLVNPLLREVYQTQVAAGGLQFNTGLVWILLDPKQAVLFLLLFLAAAALIFYEYCVLINISVCCRRGEPFALGQVMRRSLWSLGALRGRSLAPGALYYVLLLPLVGIGYVNTVVPRVFVPEFVFEEMRKSTLGQAGIVAVYLIQWAAHLAMLFVPVRMALAREGFAAAARGSLTCWRRAGWRLRLGVLGILAVWERTATEISRYWRRVPLGNEDFDGNFLKFLIYGEAFRKDLLYWLLMAVLTTAGMGGLIWVLVSGTEWAGLPVSAPAGGGDGALLLEILDRRWAAWKIRWRDRLRRRGWQLAGAAVCLALAAGLLATLTHPLLLHRPFAIAHRGGEGGVENTLTAILAAQAAGMDYAEIDVQLTADGVPVLFHDGNLRRMAGREGSVGELTWAELQSVPIADLRWPEAGERISSLEEVVAALSEDPDGMGLLIELKPAARNGAALSRAVMDVVERWDFGGRAMFMSLDYPCLLSIMDEHPDWWVGFCAYGAAGDIDDAIWRYDMDFLAVEENLVSNRLTDRARELGLPVYVWSVYDGERMRQYLEMGVSGIITDYPEEIASVLSAYRDSRPQAEYVWQGEGCPPPSIG